MNIQFLFTRMGLRAFGPRTLGSKAVSFFCCMLPDVLQTVALMMYSFRVDFRPQLAALASVKEMLLSPSCVFPVGLRET